MDLPIFLTGHPEFYFILIALAVAGAGFTYAALLIFQIRKEPQGTEAMRKVAHAIQQGAYAYLNRQFKVVLIPVALIAIALYFTETQGFPYTLGRSLAFATGAIFSATVGYVGMRMAVQGNVRVAEASKTGHGPALKIAYRTGTITGMLTDSFGLLGGTVIFSLFPNRPFEVLVGFGLGGSLIALFMRVGGGIYTKSADVGADLVGKVEKNIPEDDPRNAAVIADLVGDNVGDCAGMAADIFESYEVTIVAAMTLGFFVFPANSPNPTIAALHLPAIIFPIMVRSIGVFSSIIGTYAVRIGGGVQSALRAIFRGFSISAIISVVGFLVVATQYVGRIDYVTGFQWFAATFTGIILAVVLNYITEHFTSTDKTPVKDIAKASRTGPATVILSGIASGYESTVWALVAIAGALFSSALIFGFSNPSLAFYGVSLCGIGMLTLTGNNVSMDAFGPISDNANGIAEMAGLPKDSRQVLADLDAVGNTTKAITKGIAIGSAAVAALALFAGFFNVITDAISKLPSAQVVSDKWQGLILGAGNQVLGINVTNPYVFVGLLIGGAIPFMFSSLTVRAVERGASKVVLEVRRQFAEIPGLWEGKAEPDYARSVEICTAAAQRELLGIGILAIVSPILIGFLLNVGALSGFLAGLVLVGQLLAVYMSNAGGAWDNAKKTIEDGLFGGKGSDPHKATVIGDTVGDPLKDTSGPALNPMIKVSNLVAVLLGPLIISLGSVFPTDFIQAVPAVIAILSVVALGYAIWYSKRSGPELQSPGQAQK